MVFGCRLPKLTESERQTTDDRQQTTEEMNWVPGKDIVGSPFHFEVILRCLASGSDNMSGSIIYSNVNNDL